MVVAAISQGEELEEVRSALANASFHVLRFLLFLTSFSPLQVAEVVVAYLEEDAAVEVSVKVTALVK